MKTKIKYNLAEPKELTFEDLAVGDFFFSKYDGNESDTGISDLRQKVENADDSDSLPVALILESGQFFNYNPNTRVIKVDSISIEVKL